MGIVHDDEQETVRKRDLAKILAGGIDPNLGLGADDAGDW